MAEKRCVNLWNRFKQQQVTSAQEFLFFSFEKKARKKGITRKSPTSPLAHLRNFHYLFQWQLPSSFPIFQFFNFSKFSNSIYKSTEMWAFHHFEFAESLIMRPIDGVEIAPVPPPFRRNFGAIFFAPVPDLLNCKLVFILIFKIGENRMKFGQTVGRRPPALHHFFFVVFFRSILIFFYFK